MRLKIADIAQYERVGIQPDVQVGGEREEPACLAAPGIVTDEALSCAGIKTDH